MENLVVVSKVKKFIKDQGSLNTSSSFSTSLSEQIAKELGSAIEAAKKSNRKTVMGRDLPHYAESADDLEEILVVASKVKKYVKDEGGLSTSSQVMPQLTYWVQETTRKAIENAKSQGRKTVLDRDITLQ